jgi:hypothetical protein
MTLDYEALKFWMGFIQFVGMIGVGIYAWYASRQKATAKAVEDLDRQINGRVDVHSDRITRAEITLEHLPTHKDISEISTRIESMHGEISRMSGTVTGINRAVDLMNEHLLAASRNQEHLLASGRNSSRGNEFRDKEC